MTPHPLDQFRTALAGRCIVPPADIRADGALHRCDAEGKGGKGDAAYLLHLDGIPAGGFENHRDGLGWENWRADTGRTLTPAEEAEHRAKLEASRQQREAEQARRHAEASERAGLILAEAHQGGEHPYLVKKGIQHHGAKLIQADQARAIAPNLSPELSGLLLVVPMRADGVLHSLQFITADGTKRPLTGGRVAGCYHAIGNPKGAEALCICEGFATGASIHEATGYPVAVAFSAGNLEAVALALRAKFPGLPLILCADDDVNTTGNPGLTKATEAARAVGGLLAVPAFGTDRPEKATDFNDMAAHRGLESVRAAIEAAEKSQESLESQPLAHEQWAEPEPLRATLAPAEPFPVDALGDVLGNAASAIHASVKAPLAMCCQSVLAAASLAVQAHYNIKLPWGEVKPLSLFLLTVGESGERKSGVDDLVLGAAKAQERADMELYVQAQERYEFELASWNQATDAARKSVTSASKGKATAAEIRQAVEKCGDKPIAPIAPLRFVTDPTVEGLYKLLVIGQPSVALFSDEGGLLIGGHALNSDNALKTMARWCKLWDGSPFDRVRAGDGAGILYGRRMALHQLAQPDVMTTLLSDRMANGQGLLARCLVAWPESTIGTRQVDKFEWAGDRREVKRLFAVLKSLLEAQPRVGQQYQELDPVDLPLSDDAKQLAVLAGNQFETLMARGGDLAELKDSTAKALENACRIAGVMAVIEGGMATRVIETEHLQRALVLMQWYLAEALRIRCAAAVPQSVMDAELLSAWLKAKCIREFRTKPILNGGPNQLRNKTRLMAAIKELVTCGYLVENEPGKVIDGIKARSSWRVKHHVV